MTKDELIAEIEALRQIVAMGQDRLREDQYIDMEVMQAKVDQTCQEVAELAPEDAADIREPLNNLLIDLQEYARLVGQQAEDGTTGDG